MPKLAACAAAQFYLGTTRLQLEHKGDAAHVVTNVANVVPAFGFIGIPVIGWLLDKKGYGVTLATINFLGVIASFFQAMPSLYFQARHKTLEIDPGNATQTLKCDALCHHASERHRLLLPGHAQPVLPGAPQNPGNPTKP